jgi:(p)ppGpp synthase/HD superfamily hydrolase
MIQTLNIEIEKAIRLIFERSPVANDNTRKPVLFHDIRVGTYLYENNYSRDIVLAGFLHDALEFMGVKGDEIKNEFGENVLKLVLANSKDESIDKTQRNEELIKRCVAAGQDALIVKVADTIDSFKYYTSVNNDNQLQNYCLVITDLVFKYLPSDFNDKIFGELKLWQSKFTK